MKLLAVNFGVKLGTMSQCTRVDWKSFARVQRIELGVLLRNASARRPSWRYVWQSSLASVHDGSLLRWIDYGQIIIGFGVCGLSINILSFFASSICGFIFTVI